MNHFHTFWSYPVHVGYKKTIHQTLEEASLHETKCMQERRESYVANAPAPLTDRQAGFMNIENREDDLVSVSVCGGLTQLFLFMSCFRQTDPCQEGKHDTHNHEIMSFVLDASPSLA